MTGISGGPAGDGGSAGDPRLGLTVRHRRYVPYSHAHYAGNLVDGAYALALFGDVATEVCIRTDSDEGLFAGYADVRFRAPIRAGDVLEVVATVTRVGSRSRTLDLECRVVCRGRPDRGESAAEVLDPPVVAVTAVGTVVVPVGTSGPPPVATSAAPPVWRPAAAGAPDSVPPDSGSPSR